MKKCDRANLLSNQRASNGRITSPGNHGCVGEGGVPNLNNKRLSSVLPLSSSLLKVDTTKSKRIWHHLCPLTQERRLTSFILHFWMCNTSLPFSSNPESVFRFNLRHGPARASRDVESAFPRHHGKCSPLSMHHGNCGHLSFSSFSSRNASFPSAQIHSGRQFILSLHPSVISCPSAGPGKHGILGHVVPTSLAPLSPPPCGKAGGRGPFREL